MTLKIPANKHREPAKRARRWDVHVVFDKDDYERLLSRAEQDDRAISNLVRRIVKLWLDSAQERDE